MWICSLTTHPLSRCLILRRIYNFLCKLWPTICLLGLNHGHWPSMSKKLPLWFFAPGKKFQPFSIIINGSEIKQVRVQKHLGLNIDERLTWTDHVSTIDAFPYYCPGARRGNVFVATWLLCPRPRSTSIARTSISVCESHCDHVVLARFSVWSSIFDFFWCWEDQDALSRPLFCFSLNNLLIRQGECKKKKKKKVRSQTVLLSGQWKDDPSSVDGCLVRISGSTVVCSAQVTLWLSTVECCRRRDREVSWQSFSPETARAVWGKKQRLSLSVFAIKRKQVVRASPN